MLSNIDLDEVTYSAGLELVFKLVSKVTNKLVNQHMTMTVEPSSLTFLQAIEQIYYSIWLVRKLVSMVVHKILYYFIDIKGIGLYSFL